LGRKIAALERSRKSMRCLRTIGCYSPGWVHYLAFDLFIGSWQVRDAQKHKSHICW